MIKDIYIARSANDNTDAYKATFDFDEAAHEAKAYYDHLTAKEKLTNRVTFERWQIEVPEGDARDADAIYTDYILSGEGSLEPYWCDVLDDNWIAMIPEFQAMLKELYEDED